MRLPEKTPLIPKDFDLQRFAEQLQKVNRYNELIEINDSKYYYYDKWKYKAREWEVDPVHVWGLVKALRRFSGKILTMKSSNGDVNYKFSISSPSFIQRYLHTFDLNLGGSMQGDTIIPTDDRERYLISSLMEEAIASSQLEGAATTRKVAKEMLETNRKPKNQGEQMILNNYEAMKWIVANRDSAITLKNIRQLHSILTKSTLSDAHDVGQFRKDDDVKVVDVQTGVAVYTPPQSVFLKALMKAFCELANDEDETPFFIHPITKGIVLHFLMGYIHPFVDGNGRTARTIFYWYLLKHGYWLIEYMSVSKIILESKAQYSRAYLYTEQDENDLTYFLHYNLRALNLALEDLKSYIKRKTAEKQNAITILRNTNLNDRQLLLLQEVLQDATVYFTVVQVQNRFGVSNQTARTDLNGLVADGFFEERRVGRKLQYLPIKGFASKIAGKVRGN